MDPTCSDGLDDEGDDPVDGDDPGLRGPAATSNGKAATIVGTPANETINGTAGDDVVFGAGNGTVNGGGDDDVIRCGPGDDRLDGGPHGAGPPDDNCNGEAGTTPR